MTETASSTRSPFRLLGLAIAAAVLIADQLVKWVMIGPLALERMVQIPIIPIFNLTWMENRGVSFGLFTAESEEQRWFLVAVTAIVSIGVLVWMWREQARSDVIALALVLGGALGNIIDRIRFGYVVDYADLHFGEFRPFLIFNLADAAITIGVLLLVARAFLVREKGQDNPPARGGATSDQPDP